jgi:hypothetical protein
VKARIAYATAVAVVALGSGTAAEASLVSYGFSSGEVTLTAVNANNGTSYLPAGTQLALSGGTVSFDASAGTLNSFDFLDAGPQTVTLVGGAVAGATVTVSSLEMKPGTGYSTTSWSNSGPNTYNYSVAPVGVTGMYSVNGNPAVSISHSNATPLTGMISTAMDEVQLTGITLATATIKGTPVVFKGDITFFGTTTVPLPAGVWLMLSGLVTLMGPALRRRAVVARQGQ